MSDFPTSIYTQRALENVPGQTYDDTKPQRFYAEDLIQLGDEITAIETVLGENPAGAYDTVREWLEALAAAVVAPPNLIGESVSGAINGSNAVFTVSHSPSPASFLQVYLARQLQIQGVDYTLAGNTITYLAPVDISLAGQPHLAYYAY